MSEDRRFDPDTEAHIAKLKHYYFMERIGRQRRWVLAQRLAELKRYDARP